jgi:hypothetical protein
MTTPAARALVLRRLRVASGRECAAHRRARRRAGGRGSRAAAPAVRATLDRYCLGCHNDRLRTGGLSLATSIPRRWPARRRLGTRGAKAAHPRDAARRPAAPDDSTYRATAEALERALDAEAERHPQPGRVAVHR